MDINFATLKLKRKRELFCYYGLFQSRTSCSSGMISLEPISRTAHNHADGPGRLDFLEQNKTLTASEERRRGKELRGETTV